MKAVTFHEHGGIEVLKYEEVPEPVVGPNDVLLKVKAIGVNRNDLWAREGLPGVKFDLPHISGSDAAGIVTQVGSAVGDVRVGDEVMVHPGLSCRACAQCTSGHECFCRQYKIWGFQTGPNDGAYAEYARVPHFNIIPKPKELDWPEAAALPLALLTVWHMLVTRAQLQAGEDLLLWGATGGIGSLALQVAKVVGARVLATAGTDEKVHRACEMGADAAVNHHTQDVFEAVRKFTGKKGVEVVFEHTGEATWERSIRSLGWGGRLVTCGNTTGFNAKTDLRFLFNKQLNLLGSHMGTKAELLQAMEFVKRGMIRPIVGRELPLSQAADAHSLMYSGEFAGKLVLLP